ncbi:MAG: Rieske 2Fe-2S domain-containing protein [Acidobacteriia bacterium]|nr:Rieske 2Fe-2S domain-containing protein [Terriglobia bacterium]
MLDDVDPRSLGAMEGSAASWREPIDHYRSPARLAAELQMMRRYPTPFCPSAALPEVGSYVAREAAGTPLIAVRGADGKVCVLRNVSRDRGAPATRRAGGPRAFACHSYGWAYGLDGRLRHAPDDGGVPCLDQASPGFAPVHAIEHGGLVFVTQELPSLAEASVDELLAIIPPGEQFYAITEDDVAANWKILAEGFIAGYHIRTTHRETVCRRGRLGSTTGAVSRCPARVVGWRCHARPARGAAPWRRS